MKQTAKPGAGCIEKFEDRSRELFLKLRRATPTNRPAPSASHLYPGGCQASSAGRESLANSNKGQVH